MRILRAAIVCIILSMCGHFERPALGGDDADDWKFVYDRLDVSPNYWQLLTTNPMQPSFVAAARTHFAFTDAQASSLEDLRQASETAWIEAVVCAHEALFDDSNQPWDSNTSYEQRVRDRAKHGVDLLRTLETLRDQYFEDVELLLDPVQRARWRDFDRDLRRTTTLSRFASTETEGVDLAALVNSFDLDSVTRAVVQPELDRWVEALDPLLIERNRIADTLGTQAVELGVKLQVAEVKSVVAEVRGEPVPAVPAEAIRAVLSLAAAQLAKCDRIKALTLETVDRLKPLLPDDAGGELVETIAKCDQPEPNRVSARDSIGRIFSMLQYQNTTADDSNDMFEPIESRFRWSQKLYPVNAEPLTPDQILRLRRIRADFVAECEKLEAQHSNAIRSVGSSQRRAVATPSGTLWIEPTKPKMRSPLGDWNALREQDSKLELETKRRIREVLTIRQRALVAFY